MLGDTGYEDVCPIREELLGELYRANKLGLPVLVATVPPHLRAMLALFCYRRSHLHSLGLAIAASCNAKRKVTLASGLLRTMAPLEDEPDDEDLKPAAAV